MIKNDEYLNNNAQKLGISKTLVNPNSVDLRLGTHIIEWISDYSKPKGYEQDLTLPRVGGKKAWFKKEYGLVEGQEFVFFSDSFYLCHSMEYIKVPNSKAAMLFLKSSAGRKGLEHSHAGWVDSGFQGQLTWEITCHIPVVWEVGEPMCQLVYIEAEVPEKDYSQTGRYLGQKGATEAK